MFLSLMGTAQFGSAVVVYVISEAHLPVWVLTLYWLGLTFLIMSRRLVARLAEKLWSLGAGVAVFLAFAGLVYGLVWM